MTMNTNGLAKLFSDENKANYERIAKPQEYIRRKRSLNDGDGKISSDDTANENNDQITQNKIKKIKKPKHKHSKQIQINNTNSNSNEQEAPTIPSSVEEVSNEKDERTIFVGNIPITENVNSLKSYFGQFGPVESVRLRSVPIAGTAVDEHGNQDLVKKVCVNKGKFGDQKGSFNAYIVFKNKGSVQVALSANNRVLGNRHLRVDSINPTLYPPKTSVFLGGLPFYIDEEELREYFAKSLPNGQDDIVGIRLIRDQETLVGKGIGYLALQNHEAVMKALLLDKTKFKKREIRVSSCGKRTKRTEQKKKPIPPSSSQSNDSVEKTENETNSIEPPKKKRREEKAKSNPAIRRMQMKKAIQQIVKKNAQRNSQQKHKKKSKNLNVKQAVRKLEKMNKKK